MFPLEHISILITGPSLFPSICDKERWHGGRRQREIIGTLWVKSQRLRESGEKKKERKKKDGGRKKGRRKGVCVGGGVAENPRSADSGVR